MKKSPSELWFGELRTKRGNAIVIRDDDLQATPGRIYLYNTERKAMIQYDETIVSNKLFELDEEQKNQAQEAFYNDWQEACRQLIKPNSKTQADAETSTKPTLPEEDLVIEENDDADLDED